MSTMRYVLGFAVCVPGFPRGQLCATYGGRRFMSLDRARAAMDAEARPYVTMAVVDVGTMRVVASGDFASVRLDEKATWLRIAKAMPLAQAARIILKPKEPVGDDEQPEQPDD